MDFERRRLPCAGHLRQQGDQIRRDPVRHHTARLAAQPLTLRDVARRTLVGAVTALLLSSANIFTLVYFQGHERGLICLSSCTADVTLNAITIHWVTSRATSKSDMTIPGSAWGKRRVAGAGVSVDIETEMREFGGQQYDQVLSEKQRGPIDSHITVEAYVEEYHSGMQTRYESSTPSSPVSESELRYS